MQSKMHLERIRDYFSIQADMYKLQLRISCSLVLVVLLMAPVVTNAVVHEHLKYTYFKVKIVPSRPLAILLNEATPHHKNDLVFHAYTVWNVNWRYRLVTDAAGRCSITKVSTLLDAGIDLPRLEGAIGVQSEQFENYLVALHAHELGHYAIAREAANALDNSIQAMQGMPSCTLLRASIKKLAGKIINQYRTLEIQYDNETEHGKLQGVLLDWK